ncbi:hypothetical protein, partial [Mycobacterium kiyosense]
SSWDTVRPIVEHFRFYETVAPEPALAVRTVFYTPKVHFRRNRTPVREVFLAWLASISPF